MKYWLIKSEPGAFSWDDLWGLPKRTDMWDGVRNHQAKNLMKEMKKGDQAFFYHSVNDKEIVGLCEVVKEFYPDPTVKPESLKKKDGTVKENPWVVVDFKALKKLPTPVTLEDIKAKKSLSEMVLVNNSRLSVQPVKASEWKVICKMDGV